MKRLARAACRWMLAAVLAGPIASPAQTHRAEGFQRLPAGAKVALMPIDVELFQISAGGLLEPRADWTAAASAHLSGALQERLRGLGTRLVDAPEDESEPMLELRRLHAAVSAAIALHHFGPHPLPTKDGKLDWSLGPAIGVLREKSNADYALFTYVRDSYATGERVASALIGLLFGVVILPGGAQFGYASLIELASGRVVWFNRMARSAGDLRERSRALETVEVLLEGLPE
jgi:hypothetical protein